MYSPDQLVPRDEIRNGTGMRAFMLRDPDGYSVVVNETRTAQKEDAPVGASRRR